MCVLFSVIFISFGYQVHLKNGFQDFYANKFKSNGGVLIVDRGEERRKLAEFSAVAFDEASSAFNVQGLDAQNLLIIGDSLAKDVYMSVFRWQESSVDAKDSTRYSLRFLEIDDECMGQYLTAISEKGIGAGSRVCLVGDISIEPVSYTHLTLPTKA